MLTLLCVAVSAVEVPSVWRRVRADAFIARGVQLLRSGHPRVAASYLRDATALVPEDGYTWFVLGVANAASSPVEISAKAFARGAVFYAACESRCGGREFGAAIRNDGALDAAYHNLGWVKLAGGDVNAATDYLHRAVVAAPHDPIYRVSLGLVLESGGRDGEALDQYGHAIAVRPDLVYSEFFLDLEVRDAPLADSSRKRAETILRVNPDDPIHQIRLAKLLLFDGRRDEAYELASSAVASLPNVGAAWLALGDAELYSGRVQTALSFYRRALVLDKSPETIQSLEYASGRKSPPLWLRISETVVLTSPHSRRVAATLRPARVLSADIVPFDLLRYAAPSEKRVRLEETRLTTAG